jgi:hypothetical protein
MLGIEQSALVVQVVRQAPALHMYGGQLTGVGVTHVPVPLQVGAAVACDGIEQVAEPQLVPAEYRRHAPLPLQKPS